MEWLAHKSPEVQPDYLVSTSVRGSRGPITTWPFSIVHVMNLFARPTPITRSRLCVGLWAEPQRSPSGLALPTWNESKWVKWVKLSQIESNWVKLNQLESNWVKLSLLQITWVKLSLLKIAWVNDQIESNRVKLNILESNWVKLNLLESKSNWVKSNILESNWIHLNLTESKWIYLSQNVSN